MSGLRAKIGAVRDGLWRSLPGRALAPAVFDAQARRCVANDRAGVTFGLADSLLSGDLRLEFDPRQITDTVPKRITVRGLIVEPRQHFVVPGNWDRSAAPFAETRAAVEMAGLIGGGDVTDSRTYRALTPAMEAGKPRRHGGRHLDSIATITEYCQTYVDIYQDMLSNGYRPAGPRDRRNADIGLAVGREGTLCHFRKGHHRLALAQRAKLERVVGSVRFIHGDWLAELINLTGEAPCDAVITGLADLREQNDE